MRNELRRRRIASRGARRGSAMVESALVILVFMLLLIGIGDMAQVLFVQQSLAERERSALRYGVVTCDLTGTSNMVLYGTATPADGATPSFFLKSNMVQVTRQDNNTAEDRLTLTVSNYPIDFFTPFIAGRITGKPIVASLPMELGNLPAN